MNRTQKKGTTVEIIRGLIILIFGLIPMLLSAIALSGLTIGVAIEMLD